ncbi:MAG: hypothetical protein ACOCTG_02875 [Bacteroidota bacterium]
MPSTPDLHSAHQTTCEEWNTESASDLFNVRLWGGGYFDVNDAGHVAVRRSPDESLQADLFTVLEQVRAHGASFPVLLRFQDILHDRVVRLNRSFDRAIRSVGYNNRYQGVYPIKVNQLREVVE